MIERPIAFVGGLGVAIPERVVTNHDFEKSLDTSDQWIVERTGIRERRFAGPDETVSSMGKTAAEMALRRAGVAAADLDGIIVATATPAFAQVEATIVGSALDESKAVLPGVTVTATGVGRNCGAESS